MCQPHLSVPSPLPRFLFLLLGPHGKGPQYHEIGRSMATLMTDEVRRSVLALRVCDVSGLEGLQRTVELGTNVLLFHRFSTMWRTRPKTGPTSSQG